MQSYCVYLYIVFFVFWFALKSFTSAKVSVLCFVSRCFLEKSPKIRISIFFRGHWPAMLMSPKASQMALVVKNHLPMQETKETQVQSLSWEDALEKGMVTHSSILAWRIPWTEEPGGLQPIESKRVGHDWSNLACAQVSAGKVSNFLRVFSHVCQWQRPFHPLLFLLL